MPDPTDPARRAAIPMVAVWLGAVAATSIWTLSDIKYPVQAAVADGAGGSALLTTALAAVSPVEWLILLAGAVAFGALCWQEARHGTLRARLGAGDERAVQLLFWILLVFLAHSYWHPGLLLAGDSLTHTDRVAAFSASLREGVWPIWSNYDYAGSPFLQFNEPLFFWIAGVVNLAVGDANASVKLVLFLLQIGSGVAMLALLRNWKLAALPAAIGALIYSSAWAHMHLLFYRGVFPQSLTMLFLPLAILYVDRVIAERGAFGRSWALLALICGLMVVGHPTNGVAIGVYVTAYVVLRIILEGVPLRVLIRLAAAAAAGAVVTFGVLLPVVAEGDWVMVKSDPASLFAFEIPPAEYWRHLLVWNPGKAGAAGINAAYLGIVAIVLGIAGLWAVRQEATRRLALTCAVCLFVSLFLRGDHVRDVQFTLFWLAGLASFGAARALARWPARRGAVALALVAALFVDLASTSIQPLARTDKTEILAAVHHLERSGPARTVTAEIGQRDDAIRLGIGPNRGLFGLADMPMLIGAHNMTATLAHNYIASILSLVESDLRTARQLSPFALDGLFLFDVGRIVGTRGNTPGLPATLTGVASDDLLGPTIELPHRAVIAAPALAAAPAFDQTDKPMLWKGHLDPPTPVAERVRAYLSTSLGEMEIDRRRGTAARILVRTDAPDSLPARLATVAPTVTVGRYEMTRQRVDLELTLSAPGYVRLAHTAYPWREVRVDGEEAETWTDALNAIVLRLDAGTHSIVLRPTWSALRVATGLVSIVALLLLVLFAVRGEKAFARLRPGPRAKRPTAEPIGQDAS